MGFDGKVVVVTGAARGQGATYAQALIEAGARVLAVDVSALDQLEERLPDAVSDQRLVTQRVDVTDQQAVSAMAGTAMQAWGRIDGLVNNAGLYAGLPKAPLEELEEADWDRVMSVNVKGVWLVTRAVVPVMRDAGGGSVVNVSSGTVFEGTPNFLHYVTSKGAVLVMTRAMSRELGAWNIRVNSVTPGLIANEASRMNFDAERFAARMASRAEAQSLHRSMEPDDMVGAVLFLLSDASGFISGQNLNVDGGLNLVG